MRHLMLFALCAAAACAATKPELPDAFQANLTRCRTQMFVRWNGRTGSVEKWLDDPRAPAPVKVPLTRERMAALWRVCRQVEPWREYLRPAPREAGSLYVSAVAGGEVFQSQFVALPDPLPSFDPLAPLVADLDRLGASVPAPRKPAPPRALAGLPEELRVEYAVDDAARAEKRKLEIELTGDKASVRSEVTGGVGGAGGGGSELPERLLPLWNAIRSANPFALGNRKATVTGPTRRTLTITAREAGRTRSMSTVWAGTRADPVRVQPVLDALTRIHPYIDQPFQPASAAAPPGSPGGGASGPPEPELELTFERTANLTAPPADRATVGVRASVVRGRESRSTYVNWPGRGGGGSGFTPVHDGQVLTAWNRIRNLAGPRHVARPEHPIRLTAREKGTPRAVRLSWPSMRAVPPGIRALFEQWTRDAVCPAVD
jgi:hypothetical protein